MIYYESGGIHIILKIFKCSGSVFKTTAIIALPCAAASSVLFVLYPNGSLNLLGGDQHNNLGVLSETAPWAGFSFLVGFLIVFRTSQAYGRFWEGCTASYRMRSEWFDAISALVAFTKHSDAPIEEIQRFKELVVRLCSMLHAAALAELEAGDITSTGELWANTYEIVDPGGVDTRSIESIKKSKMKTSLLFTWIQQVIAETCKTEVLNIPAPILSRVFHELANGMVAFEDAMRIAYIPFPFPYAQACDTILLLHWLLTPIITSQWVTSAVWAGIFCFTQVFILWSLNLIAIEIDHPFGKDSNDIDGERMQEELNSQLVLLLSPRTTRTPRLSTRWTPFLSTMEDMEEGPDSHDFFAAHPTKEPGSPVRQRSRFSADKDSTRDRRASTFGELFVRASHLSFASTGTYATTSKALTNAKRPSSRVSCRISEMFELSAHSGSVATHSRALGIGQSNASFASLPESPAMSQAGSSDYESQTQRQTRQRLPSIPSVELHNRGCLHASTGSKSDGEENSVRIQASGSKSDGEDSHVRLKAISGVEQVLTPPESSRLPKTPMECDAFHRSIKAALDTAQSYTSIRPICPDCGEPLLSFSSMGSKLCATSTIDAILPNPCERCKSRKDTDVYEACPTCEKHFCKKCVDGAMQASSNVTTLPKYEVGRLPSPSAR